MRTDDTLRTAMLAAVLVAFAIVFYHRIKAHRANDPLDRRQEGLIILMTLRPAAAAFFIGFGLYVQNPERMAWSAIALPDWLRWAGVVLIAAVSGLLLWTLHSLGPNLTDTVVTRKVHTLVVDGPYHWVRHPFYDAVALLLGGISLVTGNWFMLATGALVFTLLAIRARREEERLVARFGEDYRRYIARTRRFIPPLS
jgi:protein-S-isoprenylcysteine O-methyltransferase Ste14